MAKDRAREQDQEEGRQMAKGRWEDGPQLERIPGECTKQMEERQEYRMQECQTPDRHQPGRRSPGW
eukprot:6859013-Heterocapsa_arctica.AAC.1